MASIAVKNWQRFGLCVIRKINPELFFIADTNHYVRNRLRVVCGLCPVRKICLDSNLLVSDGMFGGFTRRERMDIAIRRGVPYDKLPTSAKELIASRKSERKARAKRGRENGNRSSAGKA